MEVSGENLDSFLEEAKGKGMHVIDNNKVKGTVAVCFIICIMLQKYNINDLSYLFIYILYVYMYIIFIIKVG